MCAQKLHDDLRDVHDDGPASRVRTRAARALGVSPGATPATARAAFVRRLADTDLVPPEECVAATNTLAGTPLPLTPVAADGSSAGDFERFAAEFWLLAPPERRARWAELSARCPDRHSARRLRQVEPGLDVAALPHPDPVAAEVASFVRELFLLPPRERAIRRVTRLMEHSGRFGELTRGARLVLKHDMPTAKLDPRLFDWFASGRCPAPVVAVFPGESQADTRREVSEVPADADHPRSAERPKSRTGEGANAKVIWLVLFLLIAFLRVLGSSHNTTPTVSTNVPFQAFKEQAFTTAQIEEFVRYEQNQQKGPPPPGYTTYRAMNGKLVTTSDGKVVFKPSGGPTPSGTTPTKPR